MPCPASVPQGVLIASPLAYIIPPCCVMRLRQEALLSRANIGPMLLTAFGLLVMVVGCVMALVDTIRGGGTCTHGAEPLYCPGFLNTSAPGGGGGGAIIQSTLSPLTITTTPGAP